MRGEMLSCAGFPFLLLLPAAAAGFCIASKPLPAGSWDASPGNPEKCAFGGCCGTQFPGVYNWMPMAGNRTGLPSTLITLVGDAKPMADILGVHDISTLPFSADRMAGQAWLDVQVTLRVISIWAIDQKNGNFKMQYELIHFWRDCRLIFGCDETLSVTPDSPDFKKYWRPQMAIKQMQDQKSDMREYSHQVDPRGLDIYTERHVATFSCKFNFADLPLDEHECPLLFFLPNQRGIHLHWAEIKQAHGELGTAEWDIQPPSEWSRHSGNTTHKYKEFFQPDVRHHYLGASFIMKRRQNYLMKQFVLQLVLFYIISWLALFIDIAAVPARVAAHVIPALCATNKLNALASTLPPIAYSTRLDDFLIMSLFLIIIHFGEYICAHNAAKIKKQMDELDKKRTEDVEQNTSGEKKATAKDKCKRLFVMFTQRILCPGLKMFSPIIYTVISLLIFLA